jgi:hypothetical protein
MNDDTSALIAVRKSAFAPFWITSVKGSGENSDGSSNGTTVDLAMVAYPLSLRLTASFNTAMICRLLQTITNFRRGGKKSIFNLFSTTNPLKLHAGADWVSTFYRPVNFRA